MRLGKRNNLIELKNVDKKFQVRSQDVSVLKNISLQILDKDFCIIFGPSGCGKSTLLHVILGLELPTNGFVYYKNTNLYQMTEDEISDWRKLNIGVIYQQPNWIRSLTVLENVEIPASLSGLEKIKAKDRATTMLQLVGMLEWANYRPMELSAGQQQKVALARALVTNPSVIIADEPTGNLDYQSGIELMSLFKQLRQTGKTIVMVTHNIENISDATKVIQMFDGQILNIYDITETKIDDIKTRLIEGLNPGRDTNIIQKNRNFGTFISVNKSKKSVWLMLKNFLNFTVTGFFSILQFTFILFLYLIEKLTAWIIKFFSIAKMKNKKDARLTLYFAKLFTKFSKSYGLSMSPVDIIDLSLKNMFYKKARAVITIGGMALGISFIVFLVSIGYGIENLIVSRVSALNEIKQITANAAVASNIKITDQTISIIKENDNVEKVLPSISAVGKVNYQDSRSDVVVYGVQSDYLRTFSSKPIQGTYFESNNLDAKNIVNYISTDNNVEDNINIDSINDNGEIIKSATSDSIEITLPVVEDRQAVVNTAFLNLLSISQDNVVGKKFKISFVLAQDLTEFSKKVVATPVEYEIVGVVPSVTAPLLYVPISHLKQMNTKSYTSLKIIATNDLVIPNLRRQIEAMGLNTISVQDTITQISNFFSSARIFLAMIGAVALSVAALGMFNTLSVSLLERIREVGLMKAIGMRSDEVQRLFLTESMVLGVLGGIWGLILGSILGKALSSILSVFSIARGYGYIDVTLIPIQFMLIVMFIAVVIGFVTGIYPSQRAKRISALNALRYE